MTVRLAPEPVARAYAWARCEPKRLRYRLLHTAARLTFHARTAILRLQHSWPWARELAAAFARLHALPAPRLKLPPHPTTTSPSAGGPRRESRCPNTPTEPPPTPPEHAPAHQPAPPTPVTPTETAPSPPIANPNTTTPLMNDRG